MKPVHMIFAALSALLLAACGSNGGTYQGALPDHSAKTTVKTDTVHQGSTVGKPDTPPAAPPAVQNQGIAGYYMQVLPGRNSSQILLTDEGNQNLDYLMVNGEKIPLAKATDSKRAHYLLTRPDILSYGAVVKNALEADQRIEYWFVHGKMTPAERLPTQDKVLVYRGMSRFGNAQGIGMGKSHFDVNFGRKTLSGKVTANGTDIPITATIEDGQFRNPGSEGTYVKGAFYGNHGEDLGGVFKSGDTVGVFGATKEK